MSDAELRFDARRRALGRWLGPGAAAAIWFAPMALDDGAHRLAAICTLVVIWWITEAIPLAVTAIVGPALCVLTGVAGAKDAFRGFAHPLIFLFLGGFILARALSVCGVDRRITLWLLSRRWIGGRPARAFAAVTAITWGFSMWVSNTATTAMMLPIALGLAHTLRSHLPNTEETDASMSRWTEGLMITLAYAASLGGVATPVGTAPNMIAIEQIESQLGQRIDFVQWMMFAFPVSACSVAVLLALSLRRFPAPAAVVEGLTEELAGALRALGPIRPAQRRVVAVFVCTVLGWLTPAALRLIDPGGPLADWGRAHMHEGVVALLGVAALFLLPGDAQGSDATKTPDRPRLITWSQAVEIDWGTLLLLGGGFAMSSMVFETGLADALARAVLRDGSLPGGAPVLVFAAVGLVIYLTEVASNTATTNMMLPVLIPVAVAAGFDARLVAIGVAIAASYAFMLPVSTPPNAIAYGSGQVRIISMVRYGARLDLLSLAALWVFTLYLLPLLLP
ncbi:MAG: SLC13 family permease [Nannocystaceae bacterium]